MMQLFKAYFFSALTILTTLFIYCPAQAALFERDEYFDKNLLPKESRVPGGIALLDFESKQQPQVSFQNNEVMVLQTGKEQWTAVVGLSLSLKPGLYQAQIISKKDSLNLDFEVVDKEYEAQYITIKDKEQVNPSAETLERIRREAKIMKDAFLHWSKTAPRSLQLDYPVDGPLSSQFGLKRFFNNQPRNPHSGLDIAAATGTEIKTPISGKVLTIGSYHFNGNTILIDHGQGMISMFCHLDTIQVKEGELLTEGQLVGTVGSTGRATGPHLHWSLNLNNTRVDPLLFLKTKN